MARPPIRLLLGSDLGLTQLRRSPGQFPVGPQFRFGKLSLAHTLTEERGELCVQLPPANR